MDVLGQSVAAPAIGPANEANQRALAIKRELRAARRRGPVKEGAMAANFTGRIGSVFTSRDGRRYEVQKDGSWRKAGFKA